MDRWVEISFDCAPLRTIGRLEAPVDASPKYQRLCDDIRAAIEAHGTHNTYYLYNARCVFHLTNDPALGMLEFQFEGTVFTDDSDERSERSDLKVELLRETCDWLTGPVVAWFAETVPISVEAEFNRYIAAGDLKRARERIEKMQSEMDKQGGYVGMYL